MEINTHRKIDPLLCGRPVELKAGYSRVEMVCEACMAADEKGLVHGGFIFGLADYAAMIAVNHPNVVLGGANSRFLKPVSVGETVTAEARLTETSGRKHTVAVSVEREGEAVFNGQFTCFVLEAHVLE